jgi:uncharacterized DUF497 family protein
MQMKRCSSLLLDMLYTARSMDLQFHHENLAKHGVLPEEVEECFDDRRKIAKRLADMYWLIGKTQGGRLLQVGYRKLINKTFFVFHAMPATEAERKRYKTRGK